MRVLVTGGRHYDDDKGLLWRTLDELQPIECLIVGDATGADEIAALWAKSRGIPCIKEEASWDGRWPAPDRWRQGVMDSLIRNIRMIERHKPDLVVAAPGGADTEHCIKNALLRGVKVKRITT